MTKNKALSIFAACVAFASPVALISAPELEETRSTLEQWVELKKITSEEKNKWKVERELLEESIDLLQEEIQGLKDGIKENEDAATDAEKERQKLNLQEEELKQASAVVRIAIGGLEEEARGLLKLVPASLADKLSIVSSRIPKTAAEAKKLSLSVRLQNVVGVLQEIEKFNSQVSMESSMREIDGQNMQVKTLYIGLAIGYYADELGVFGGVLKPSANGWVEESNNEMAPEIARAIAIYEREATADFVGLPFSATTVN